MRQAEPGHEWFPAGYEGRSRRRGGTTDQDLTVQLEALKSAGCTIVRSEKATGTHCALSSSVSAKLTVEEAKDRANAMGGLLARYTKRYTIAIFQKNCVVMLVA
jgi:hypothetical protein